MTYLLVIVFCMSIDIVTELFYKAKSIIKNYDLMEATSNSELDQIHQTVATMNGKEQCLVFTTTILSMGVDFTDVDLVVHIGSAYSVVNYLQETGRGGRNGGTCICVVLTSHGYLKNEESKYQEMPVYEEADILSRDLSLDFLRYTRLRGICLRQWLNDYLVPGSGPICLSNKKNVRCTGCLDYETATIKSPVLTQFRNIEEVKPLQGKSTQMQWKKLVKDSVDRISVAAYQSQYQYRDLKEFFHLVLDQLKDLSLYCCFCTGLKNKKINRHTRSLCEVSKVCWKCFEKCGTKCSKGVKNFGKQLCHKCALPLELPFDFHFHFSKHMRHSDADDRFNDIVRPISYHVFRDESKRQSFKSFLSSAARITWMEESFRSFKDFSEMIHTGTLNGVHPSLLLVNWWYNNVFKNLHE